MNGAVDHGAQWVMADEYQGGPDGPVADSDDGYKILPGEEEEPEEEEEHEEEHDIFNCDCPECRYEQKLEDGDRRYHERIDDELTERG